MNESSTENGANDPASRGQVIDFKQAVERLSEEKTLRAALVRIAESFDDSRFMSVIRKGWEALPKAAQWAILHIPGITPQSQCVKFMYQLGLLEYEGTLATDDRSSISEWDAVSKKWMVKLGSLFMPEVKAFRDSANGILKNVGYEQGLDELLEHQSSLQQNLFAEVRTQLNNSRREKENNKKARSIAANLNGDSASEVQEAA